ncbi:hypothetical protein EPUS_07079 [Endocarpon pusillum Z07020]|uniref:Heterokaryon incompatibility domain-containing protein n=1 Tax=Endocarpon pusillum (strain Z07020 / HMAS-L-300199) TaxID=1263415 RepID=U1GFF0_ENDPU|nr:uncharacterized protein EPUS_07079 [Endocarpon pusillum Z07020]ERF76372.1 hypothetical protein EPUS_07079 [Endocarpon pusillum Z07020]
MHELPRDCVMDELDKALNRKSGFKYIATDQFDARQHVRLLRTVSRERDGPLSYSLEIVPLEHLRGVSYKALSYTWGRADLVDAILVDGQKIFIRRNLYDFLEIASAKGEHGLLFIDAICINQNDHNERQSAVQEMARIYRNADQVIGWLGPLEPPALDNVRALVHRSHRPAAWTAAQWDGFRYLSCCRYWSRVWVVQEVLLASNMSVWCGAFTFPLTLFGMSTPTMPRAEIRVDDNGRPAKAVSALSLLRSPAETIVTHRSRLVHLRNPYTVTETFQSQTPDLLHEAVSNFGSLESSDPRDKLYGLLGILDERTRARVEPDYTKGVSHAFYQALKIGLQELHCDSGVVSCPKEAALGRYLAYYCDARDAFGMADGESISLLRQVLSELCFQTVLEGATLEVQWQQQFVWRDSELVVFPDFKRLLAQAEEKDEELYPKCTDFETQGQLFKFHARQHGLIKRLGAATSHLLQRRSRIGGNYHALG